MVIEKMLANHLNWATMCEYIFSDKFEIRYLTKITIINDNTKFYNVKNASDREFIELDD